VPSDPQVVRRNIAVVLLAINSGFTDAVGYLALGGSFTSVMTGNMVLLGLSAGTSDGHLALSCAIAIVSFIGGCAAGTHLAGSHQRDDPVWPRQVSLALTVQLVIALAFSIGWWVSGNGPDGNWRTVWLAVNAVALGMQSSSVQRFGVSGLSTTYLTGTLTQMVIRLTSTRNVRTVGLSGPLLLGLVGGAVLAALLATYTPGAVPVAQPVLLALALLRPWIGNKAIRPRLSSSRITRSARGSA
jgi:uncharacterized membrane protein YoaK (UPF0700 family)